MLRPVDVTFFQKQAASGVGAARRVITFRDRVARLRRYPRRRIPQGRCRRYRGPGGGGCSEEARMVAGSQTINTMSVGCRTTPGSTVLTPGPFRRQPGRDRPPLQEHAQQPHDVAPDHLRKRPPQLPVRNTRHHRHLQKMPVPAPPATRRRPYSRFPAHSTSRSRPSLPITGVVPIAGRTIRAQWQADC